MNLRTLNKTCQKGCYSFLNSSVGACVIFISAVITINTCLHTIDEVLGTSIICDAFPLHDYSDNIAERSYERSLCDEPIDAVYTWVNGSEEAHQAEVAYWQLQQAIEGGGGGAEPRRNLSEQQLVDQSSKSRFEDHEELRYSLRGLQKYAGWIRHVYIVTNGQVPTWLDLSHPRVTIVPHSAIFPSKSHLPTFSSPAIEANLHRIPGLSKRFVYLNDDTFFGAPVVPDDFESQTKGIRLFYSWPVPACADGCPAAWLGDGTCDKQCNTTDCDYDAGDCVGDNVKVVHSGGGHAATGRAQQQNCNGMCADGWLGDKYCDAACNNADCGFDGTDCGITPYLNESFPRINLQKNVGDFHVPDSTRAFLVNLTALFPLNSSRITAGDHDNPSWVRSATISQGHKILVIAVASTPGNHPPRCRFVVKGEIDMPNAPPPLPGETDKARTQTLTIHFNISLVHAMSVSDAALPDAHRRIRRNATTGPHDSSKSIGTAVAPSTQRSLLSLGRSVAGLADVEMEVQSTQRRLLDMFGDSLKFTNKLLSKRFRSIPRSVPAHMAHMIHRDVIEALWELWPKEWAATSASKFRSRSNLQYAFMHYYYVVHAKRSVPFTEIFDKMLDVNENGVLDYSERRRVHLMLWEKNVALESLEALCKQVFTERHAQKNESGWETSHDDGLRPPSPLVTPTPTMAPIVVLHGHHNRSSLAPASPVTPHPGLAGFSRPPAANPDDNIKPIPIRYHALVEWLLDAAARGWGKAHDIPSAPNGRLTAHLLANSHVGKLLLDAFGTVDAFRRVIEELEDVTFVMVRNNATVVQHQMDHILYKRPKFLCINDDMNHSHPEHRDILGIVQTLLDTYYPVPSSFELPEGLRNSFTRFTEDEVRQGNIVPQLIERFDARQAVLRSRGRKVSPVYSFSRVTIAVAALAVAVFLCVRKFASR